MFLIPDPVSMWESAINGKMERELADELLGMGLSALLTFPWSLRSVPLIGKSLGAMAMSMKLNLWNGALLKRVAVTVPKSMEDPDIASQYVTTTIEKVN